MTTMTSQVSCVRNICTALVSTSTAADAIPNSRRLSVASMMLPASGIPNMATKPPTVASMLTMDDGFSPYTVPAQSVGLLAPLPSVPAQPFS
jgi:hypothetical protein